MLKTHYCQCGAAYKVDSSKPRIDSSVCPACSIKKYGKKMCYSCKKPKTVNHFAHSSCSPDDLKNHCRMCMASAYKAKTQNKYYPCTECETLYIPFSRLLSQELCPACNIRKHGKKRCLECNRLLKAYAFGKNRTRPDGLQDKCRQCKSISDREPKRIPEKTYPTIKDVSTMMLYHKHWNEATLRLSQHLVKQ